MKKQGLIWFAVVWVLIPNVLHSQISVKDSLKKKLTTYTQIDKNYLEDLYQLAFSYAKDGTDTMYQMGKTLIQLADSLDYPPGLAKGYRVLCGWYRDQADFEKGVDCCKKAIHLGDSLSMDMLTAQTLNTLATVYEYKHPDSSLIYVQKALDIFRESGNTYWEGIGLQSMGNLYRNMANYEKSIEAHEAALNIFKQNDAEKGDGVPGQLINLGTVYKVSAETRSDSILKVQDLDKARNYLEEAISRFQKIDQPFGEMVAAINLAQVFLLKGDFLLSLSAYDRALEINKQLKHTEAEIIVRWGKITIQRRMGHWKESKKQALALLHDPSLDIVDQSLKDIYSTLHETSFEMKQWEDAYSYLLKKVALEKKFEWNSQLKTRLETLSHEYEAKLHQNKLALLEAENRSTRIYKYGLWALLLASILLVSSWLIQAISKQKEQAHIQQEKAARLQAESALANEKVRQSELETQQLNKAISLKNQAISSYALQLAQKNQWLESLRHLLDQEISPAYLKQEIKAGLDQDRNWEELRGLFEDLHPEFLPRLKRQFPELSKSDLRLAALYKMQLSREEMLRFLAIAPESFKMARYRLRKKLGLSGEQEISKLIQSF